MFDDQETHDPGVHRAVPPTEPMGLDVEPELPKWPKVVGIISIVFAGVGLTCSGCGVVGMTLSPQLAGMAGAQAGPLPPSMQFGAMQYVQVGVGVVLTLVLLAAGIATLRRRYTGRPLHLVYGVLTIPQLIWSIMTQLDVATKMNQWVAANPDSPFAQGHSPAGVWIGIGMTLLIGLPWPLFCLAWFGFVKTKPDDFTGGHLVDRV